jgi:phosphatidate cytidylyltransferase
VQAVAVQVTTVWGTGRTEALLKRLATAVVFIPVFVWLVTQGPAWLFQALVVVAAGLATFELGRALERGGRPLYRWLAIGGGIAVTASFIPPAAPVAALTAVVLLALAAPVWAATPPAVEPSAMTLLSLVYVNLLLGHAILLHGLPQGGLLILLLVGITWTGESAAYLVGSAIGRRKLAPTISPNKTLEGSAAQLVVSGAAAVLLAAWLLPTWAASAALTAGLLLGVIGQIGDLAESVIKRSVGVKDMGAVVPGHGGMLDRLDSLLFNVPAFFYYLTYVGGPS